MAALNPVQLIVPNLHGIYTVYGLLGIKQYVGCSKSESEMQYRKEYEEQVKENKRKGVLYGGKVQL